MKAKTRHLECDQHQSIERALKESQQQYLKIIDAIPDGYTEFDLAGTITFVNNATIDMTSRPRKELVGLNYKRFLDEETVKKVYQTYNKVYTTKKPKKGFIHEIIKKDGEKRIIECSISLREKEGEIVGFRGIWQDITDRKRTEEELANNRSRLEAIFESVNEAIIAVNKDGTVTEANRATEYICGKACDTIVSKPFMQNIVSCRKSCQDVLYETLKTKTTIREYQIECARGDRPQQVVVVTSSPLKDRNDNFLGAVLVIRDLTRLLGLEKELRGRYEFQNLIGKSKRMQEIYDLIENLTNMGTTVLITGETGTGKELVAKALHYSGDRAFKPFLKVNCSALTENLLESELFGHVKGAFTGAIKDRAGRFQAANGGTIFLDEIGDISPLIQLKLLRVLQEKEFERVGESIPQKVDVRVIASTNKNLKDMVNRGEFRADLFYRLKVVEIVLPLLRHRLEDLPSLVEHFRTVFNSNYNKNIRDISDTVLGTFMNYPWPGNVRELEHAIEHAFVLCNEPMIDMKHLPPEIRMDENSGKMKIQTGSCKQPKERSEILNALEKTDWNKAKAARLLGIHRKTIYRKIHQFKISASR